MMKYVLVCILILEGFSGLSQNRNVLKVVSENLSKEEKRLMNYKAEHPDSLSAIMEVKKLLVRLWERSYILATSDSIYKREDTLYVKLEIGPSWKWAQLSSGNVPAVVLNRSGFKEKFYNKTPFQYSQIAKFQKEVLKYSEDRGYPFATISLDTIDLKKSNELRASLNYQSGPMITFDSMLVTGKTKVKARFLSRYLRIIYGQPFSQEKVNNINRLLKELPYLRQTRPPAIIFDKNRAVIQLFLEERRSNQIDGIVGFLPNESPGKKMLITGELNLNLKNLFVTGKGLSAEWQKFNQASQRLDLAYFHPRLFASNLDVKFDFNLFKQDTSFLNISRKITISQTTSKYGRLNFQGGLRTSRELISSKLTDKAFLPPFSNYDYYIYGLGYDWNNLNDYFYPRKGWRISVQGLVGNKSIIKSTGYADSLYNKLQLKSVQLNATINVEKYLRLGKNSVLLSKLEGGHIFNNQQNIFFNDMFRIGGLKSLRGFNENNFYALSYGLATLEYRFFTDETSYLLLFFDQAFIRNPLNQAISSDWPLGFGAGISFSTNVGIFNFIYSLGNAKSQNLNFNLSKIHFGMISRF